MKTWERLLAIDPGNMTGWAFFTDGLLTKCGQLHRDAEQCWKLVLQCGPTVIVCEQPQIYQEGQGKGDPNKLLDMCREGGWFEMLATQMRIPFFEVLPRVWKGQLPKPVDHRRSASTLLPQELDKTRCLGEDGWDAVGLGLWKLERRKR